MAWLRATGSNLETVQRSTNRSRTRTPSLFDGGTDIKTATESVWIPDLPGVGSFVVRGQHLDLPKGFRTIWKTRPLAK